MQRDEFSILTTVSLGFKARLLYYLTMPNDPREGGVLLEVWCELMKAELKIARKEFVELRRDCAKDKHWLYAQSCLEECSSALDIISVVIPKNAVRLKSPRSKD
jgi:hypothetical protein